MNVEIRNSTRKDIKKLVENIRDKDRLEALALGFEPEEGLNYCYDYSVYRRTALVNGKVAAMWGIGGDLFGAVGRPYFVTSYDAEKISPIKFARIYKQEVEAMRTFFPMLENYVDASYAGAIRMLEIAGFDLDGLHYLGPDKSPFYRFT